MHADIPKQYLQLGEQSVIEHTLGRLCNCEVVERLVVGIARGDSHWQQLGFGHDKLCAVVEAGAERVDTVANCLQYIADQGGHHDWALVHDAARPCVRIPQIANLVGAVVGHADGGLLAVPVSDTLKRAAPGEARNRVTETVSRDDLWRAMTPQLFRVGELLAGIQKARIDGVAVTDEASAMESGDQQVLLISCSPDNIKITLPQDIRLAEMILRAQSSGN